MSIMLRLIAFALLLAATVLFASSLKIGSTSAQNANSSTTAKQPQQDFSQRTWELPDDADQAKNPVAVTPESIAKGKELYFASDKGNCIFCHGETGAGNEANLPQLRRKPANLSNKERMTAMTDGELFWKITKGIPEIMPAGERRMKEPEERWHVVNYIRTLAKENE